LERGRVWSISSVGVGAQAQVEGGHLGMIVKGNSGRCRMLVDVNVRESEDEVRRRREGIRGWRERNVWGARREPRV
jgi:hypothetical protein